MRKKIKLNAKVSLLQLGQRLDQTLKELFPNYSRSFLKAWILNQCVSVNGSIVDKAKKKVSGGELISIDAEIKERTCWVSKEIPLNIVYEDNEILLINKPSQLVVHPGPGHDDDTVMNAILYHFPESACIPRAGIVHRLDKDTTGLMVIAKTISAHNHLLQDLRKREIIREYEAIVSGRIIANGKVDAPIGRHIKKRTHMAVNSVGKPAITHYRIIKNFRHHTWLRLQLETGRTHQIRVHMSHISHPIVGDPIYSRHSNLPKGSSEVFMAALSAFNRQALHATMLRMRHPVSGIAMEWHTELPMDMVGLINEIQIDTENFQQKNN
ncbi:23S rRNA pseudouridine(1911/1915/1917) synthase RluD [Candidatus Erwinia haradaeae]|uniref:Pseudouridine synthase n=1 Tax=Candidatus Erwinia haradaeae TaxID=1922217 RepID=A0A451DM99_9GAMM|nr:23S rRNA pseudouridine(1911/1915/1917) synthase RluD [Candidatus Erwinia haradaeae]VFP87899.1 Ribosomal large subunit pseudouridine synthase D [Candidatus Erwinia haradaeae]